MISRFIELRYRTANRFRIKYRRVVVACILKFWVRRITGLQNIPLRGPIIIVSNHVSYSDFLILAAILDKRTLFVATSKLQQRRIINWFLKLNTIIYLNADKPGYAFFKQIIRYLALKRNIVIYPEGTRSKSGKMLLPKLGFIKLSIKTGVPIVPVAMKGTYKILPPHKRLPRLRRCEVVVGRPIFINNENLEFRDIFYRNGNFVAINKFSPEDMQEMAIRVMDRVRKETGGEWDDSAVEYFRSRPKRLPAMPSLLMESLRDDSGFF